MDRQAAGDPLETEVAPRQLAKVDREAAVALGLTRREADEDIEGQVELAGGRREGAVRRYEE